MLCRKNISLFFTVLILFSACAQSYSGKKQPLAVNGVLDLRGWSFEKDGPLELNGKWEFYWKQLLKQEAFQGETQPPKTGLIKLPGTWNGYRINNEKLSGNGYATYRLLIRLDPGQEFLALHIPEMGNAYSFFLNGKPVSSNGRVAKNRADMIPQWLPRVEYFQKSGETMEVLLRISNYHHSFGGPWSPIRLGSATQITRTREIALAQALFIIGSLVIMGLYHLGIFFRRRKDRAPLYFGLFCLLIGIRGMLEGEFFLIYIFPNFPWELMVKIGYTTFYMGLACFISFLDGVFTGAFNKRVMGVVWFVAGLFTLLVFVLPARIFSHMLPAYQIFAVVVILYLLYVLLVAIFRKMEGASIFFLGSLILGLSTINDILHQNEIIHTVLLTPVGLFFFIFVQAYLLSSRSSRAFNAVEVLSTEMEAKVDERTREAEAGRQELALANEKLTKMDRAKTRFFANISHEFRTPLTLILGPVDSILKGAYGENVSRNNDIFKSVLRNGQRLLRLINNLLDFTKIEAGRMTAKKQKTEMVKLLKYYKAGVQSAVESEGLRIAFQHEMDALNVYLDQDLMEKAVMNLLSNALKFTPAGGDIILELVSIDEGQFRISVKDSGIGVPEDKLESIFERFSQADDSVSRKHEGTGIGLSLTKEIVELHGGTIQVKNNEDRGAVFILTLPVGSADKELNDSEIEDVETIKELKSYLLVDLSEKVEPALEADKHCLHEHTLLLVEDNQDMRFFLKSLLEREYNLIITENGKEGLAKAQVVRPDLVLSDVMMPEMDGYEMTENLKRGADTRDIPVILLSAKADVSNKIEGLTFGADDYLSKPFNAEELKARIRNQIEGKNLERKLKKREAERDKDFKQAALVQKSILTPRDFIRQIESLEIELAYLPMNGQVSGDYYNISRLESGIASIFLADATGHGTQAALSTMQIDLLYRETLAKINPNQCFEHINQKFMSELTSKNYFTGIIVDISRDRIVYSSAGHPEQFLIKSESKDIRKLRTRGGMIGVMDGQRYEMEEVPVESGDVLLLFSDGIFEVFNDEGEEFGDERFLALIEDGVRNGLGELPMAQVIESILSSLNEFRGDVPFGDDITLIGVRVK